MNATETTTRIVELCTNTPAGTPDAEVAARMRECKSLERKGRREFGEAWFRGNFVAVRARLIEMQGAK